MAGRKGGEAVSRDRAHMAAIGREGGHSRGARARAAAGGSGSGNTDVAQGTGSQPFVRQANEERSGIEGNGGRSTSASGMGSDRSGRNDSESGVSGRDRF